MKIKMEDGQNVSAEELWQSLLHRNPLYKALKQSCDEQTDDITYTQINKEISQALEMLASLGVTRGFAQSDKSISMMVKQLESYHGSGSRNEQLNSVNNHLQIANEMRKKLNSRCNIFFLHQIYH